MCAVECSGAEAPICNAGWCLAGKCGALRGWRLPPFNLSARLCHTEEWPGRPLRAPLTPKKAVFECFWVFYVAGPGARHMPPRLFRWLGAENEVCTDVQCGQISLECSGRWAAVAHREALGSCLLLLAESAPYATVSLCFRTGVRETL